MATPLALLLSTSLEIEELTPEENRLVALRRQDALAATGRLELDDSAMHLLAQSLKTELGEFPPDAVDAFYTLRDELPANIPDVEVVETLAAAARRLGGEFEAVDVPELARELLGKENVLSPYSITDDAGRTYRWDPQSWDHDEFAPGWDGERWEDDYDD